MTSALRRTKRTALLVAAAALAAGCAQPNGTTGSSGGSASCAFLVTYGSRTYQDVAHVRFTVGDRLGTATAPPCDDTPGDGDDGAPAAEYTAYAVRGLGSGTAIAVGDTPAEATLMAVRSTGGDLPAEVRRLIDAP